MIGRIFLLTVLCARCSVLGARLVLECKGKAGKKRLRRRSTGAACPHPAAASGLVQARFNAEVSCFGERAVDHDDGVRSDLAADGGLFLLKLRFMAAS